MQTGQDNKQVASSTKDDVEADGLGKVRLPGLATLTILELAKDFIKARRPALKDFDYTGCRRRSARLQDVSGGAHRVRCFQFRKSAGMQRHAEGRAPTRIEELFALNAMFRPGPRRTSRAFARASTARKR